MIGYVRIETDAERAAGEAAGMVTVVRLPGVIMRVTPCMAKLTLWFDAFLVCLCTVPWAVLAWMVD